MATNDEITPIGIGTLAYRVAAVVLFIIWINSGVGSLSQWIVYYVEERLSNSSGQEADFLIVTSRSTLFWTARGLAVGIGGISAIMLWIVAPWIARVTLPGQEELSLKLVRIGHCELVTLAIGFVGLWQMKRGVDALIYYLHYQFDSGGGQYLMPDDGLWGVWPIALHFFLAVGFLIGAPVFAKLLVGLWRKISASTGF
ncbi:hypothetical protein [Stratiformator vulcanicus]|uniref:Uncharacterized protein n=1 Tax=Stratiformator vulcanicus TaxID=2527980 RepID=A0A517R1F2_9PLAN|nr:hypothetical protein [Stratiformator vulcanicus]QDT37670.1 hypothetical protein Pan189_20510 [Stratiformator vulcanicus]